MIIIQLDFYFVLGLFLGVLVGLPLIALAVLWFSEWPGRFIQVGDPEYTPPGRFRFIRRVWNAYVFWIKYDVIPEDWTP